MRPTAWMNGALLDAADARITLADHGLVVGDGVFEALKVRDGVPFALTRHLQRLRRSAAGLGLGEIDTDEIRRGSLKVCAAGGPGLGRLRITVTGGVSPLGSERGGGPLTTVIGLDDLAEPAPSAGVLMAPWRRNEHGALTGLKTTSYAENVRALALARSRGASEAVFANTAGNLCEGTGTNVFVVTGGRLVTPPLSAGCLAGITRALVLEWHGGEEADLPAGPPAGAEPGGAGELTGWAAGAEEAFLTSTGRDVQAIRSVDGRELPLAPGPVTRKVAETFAQRAAENPDP